jgi:transposase
MKCPTILAFCCNTIQDSGNHVLFIPPYSPDLNPIEEMFSSLKTYIKKFITPLHTNINIQLLITNYIAENHNAKGYYKHAFDVEYENG